MDGRPSCFIFIITQQYLGNSIKATEDNLVNVAVEEKGGPLTKNFLEKTVNSLSHVLRQL